ncbi:MAG: hypothetical protein ACKOWF_14160 [Chloroflexota bacterium]
MSDQSLASPLFAPGNFHYLPGVFQYSAGVAAADGYRLERARFDRPVPLAEAFGRVRAHLAARNRPTEAFCACELRSPAPFTEAGFLAFNREYAGTLDAWGLLVLGDNPVARSNVCPAANPPAEPSMHAFCYTMPASPAGPREFVIAGSGEAEEGAATWEEAIVARGDTSPGGIARKAGYVVGEMERRLAGFGRAWADCSAVQLYTVYDAYPVIAGEVARRRAWGDGLAWHWCRPPVVGIDFEMDCRRVGAELLLEG